MALSNALVRSLVPARGLALAALLVALPGLASAAPMVMGSDSTECLDRQTAILAATGLADSEIHHDAANGNFWSRRDIFTVDSDASQCEGVAFIEGISIIMKTPFQIDSVPDIDDIDSAADFSILAAELDSQFPDFDLYGANAEPGPMPPTIGPAGAFIAARMCIEVDGSSTVADCLGGGSPNPITVQNIGGGYMIFSIGLASPILLCDFFFSGCDGTSLNITTLAHSNVFDPPDGSGDVDAPELVIGWQFAKLVPEPALLSLLAPAFAALLLRRRRS